MTHCVTLIRDGHHFIWLYDDSHRCEALRSLGRAASDERTCFTWYDAALVSQRMKELEENIEPRRPAT